LKDRSVALKERIFRDPGAVVAVPVDARPAPPASLASESASPPASAPPAEAASLAKAPEAAAAPPAVETPSAGKALTAQVVRSEQAPPLPRPQIETSTVRSPSIEERVAGTAKARTEGRAASVLVRASAKHDNAEAKARLLEARNNVRDHVTEPRALRAWAMAAIQAGEIREARRAAEVWAVHDSGVEPRLFLASALEASGRRREARSVLEEWLANHPNTPEARKMLQRLGASPEPAIKRSGRTRSTHASSRAP